MKPRLDSINTNEVLAYLGCSGNAPAEIADGISAAKALIFSLATPRLTYRIIQINDRVKLRNVISGQEIKNLISGCSEVVIFGATLGSAIDSRLARLQVTDMAQAVIFDAAASAAIENVCDNFCKDMAKKHGCATPRFSPGYGDYPFSMQHALAAMLELEKQIGVTLTESGIMLPQKSVTALFGIKQKEDAK